MDEIIDQELHRITTGLSEWDQVLGGGFLPSSFCILAGEPGIGKSTLLLQIADSVANQGLSVIYFATEESLAQIKLRAVRLNLTKTKVDFSQECQLGAILKCINTYKPNLCIIDSIQNCRTEATQENNLQLTGSIGQMRQIAQELLDNIKQGATALLITSHITKDGNMAGPKLLEHLVDAVFYLQEDPRHEYKVLSATKNRFGSTQELGFFQMSEKGLEQVDDINQKILAQTQAGPLMGCSLTMVARGSRYIIVELQALCVATKFNLPQRVVNGIDPKRIMLLAAILEKYLHFKLSQYDLFFKVSGELKINEHHSDLGILLAMISSYLKQPLPSNLLALGEVSLTGQIKAPSQAQCHKMLRTALKSGLNLLVIGQPLSQESLIEVGSNEQLWIVKSVGEIVRLFPFKNNNDTTT